MIELLPSSAVKELKDNLSIKRYNHSVGVMETAFLLADSWENYSIDRTDLAWASLFHDCGKEIPKADRARICSKNSFSHGKELIDTTKLNHAPIGAKLLHDNYGIKNKDVLMAVAYHPTGHPELSPIGWIIYISDYLEPGRTSMENREEYLQKACDDPLQGLKIVTEIRIKTVRKKNKPIHPMANKFKKYLDNLKSI